MTYQKYNNPYFYGGYLADVGEIRLLKAIIAQALLDYKGRNVELKKDAKEFLDSDRFKEYTKIIEALY